MSREKKPSEDNNSIDEDEDEDCAWDSDYIINGNDDAPEDEEKIDADDDYDDSEYPELTDEEKEEEERKYRERNKEELLDKEKEARRHHRERMQYAVTGDSSRPSHKPLLDHTSAFARNAKHNQK